MPGGGACRTFTFKLRTSSLKVIASLTPPLVSDKLLFNSFKKSLDWFWSPSPIVNTCDNFVNILRRSSSGRWL